MTEAATVKPPLPLYWKLCLINGAIILRATALLVVTPATLTPQVTVPELVQLAVGPIVVPVTNSSLLHGTLAPLDRLVVLINRYTLRAAAEPWPPTRPNNTTSAQSSTTKSDNGSPLCS